MEACLQGQWVGLHNLMKITLSECSECGKIPSFGHLSRLKSLYLSSLENVKSIGSSFYGIEKCSSNNVFPSLERLELWDMPNLAEWEEAKIPNVAQVKVFPCLEYLKIRDCIQLRSAPSQFTCLKEFTIDGTDSELPLASICSIQLKTHTRLEIENIEELTCLPDWLFRNNQHLSILEIMDCPNLIRLADGVYSLNSLEELNLRDCHNLKSVPYSVIGCLTSLKKLSVWGCPKLTDFPVGMVESRAPLLEKLSIDVGDSDSWHSVSFKKTIDRVLQLGSHSLRRLGHSPRSASTSDISFLFVSLKFWNRRIAGMVWELLISIRTKTIKLQKVEASALC